MWGHCEVISCHVTAIPGEVATLVGAQMYTKHQFSALYKAFQVTFGQMASLLGHFRSREVT